MNPVVAGAAAPAGGPVAQVVGDGALPSGQGSRIDLWRIF